MYLLLFLALTLPLRLTAGAALGYVTGTGTGVTNSQYVISDGNGGLLVAGTTAQTTATHLLRTRGGLSDIRIARISASGQELWTTIVGGGGTDIALAIARDAAGNIFVAASSDCIYWDFTTCPAASASGNVLLKLTPPGDAVVVESRLALGSTAFLRGFAADDLGGMYTAGQFSSFLYLQRLDPSGAIAGSWLDDDYGTNIQAFAASPAGFWLYTPDAGLVRLGLTFQPLAIVPLIQPVTNARLALEPSTGVTYFSGILADGSLVLEKRDTNMALLRRTTFGFGVTNLDGLAVNSRGEIYLMGQTNKPSEFPQIAAFQPPTGKLIETFVTRFTPQFTPDLSSFVSVSRPTSASADDTGVVFSINGSHVGRIVGSQADLSISVRCDPRVGNSAGCRGSVVNLGPDTSRSVDLQVTLPQGTAATNVTASQGCSFRAGSSFPLNIPPRVFCVLRDVVSGTSAEVTVTLKGVAPGAASIWRVNSLAGTDPNSANNTRNISFQ